MPTPEGHNGDPVVREVIPVDPHEFGLPADTSIWEVPTLNLDNFYSFLGPEKAKAHRKQVMNLLKAREAGSILLPDIYFDPLASPDPIMETLDRAIEAVRADTD